MSLKTLCLIFILSTLAFAAPGPTDENCPLGPAKAYPFDSKESLSAWTITGDVAVDATKNREGKAASLRVGPGGKALLKLRDKDGSGRLELWVYDDLIMPENPKVNRVGPRWGFVQSDGKVFAIGSLYASYLGGTEGYTASACDGQKWFDQLFWLGGKRSPAAWHKWTLNFDPDEGIQISHNDKRLNVALDKAGMKGFSGIAIWGDTGLAGRRPSGRAAWLWRWAARPSSSPPPRPIRTMTRPSPPRSSTRAHRSCTPKPTLPQRPSWRTCRSRRAFRNTASPGHSSSPPVSASSSTATGTLSARRPSSPSTPSRSMASRFPGASWTNWTASARRSSASATASCSIRRPP